MRNDKLVEFLRIANAVGWIDDQAEHARGRGDDGADSAKVGEGWRQFITELRDYPVRLEIDDAGHLDRAALRRVAEQVRNDRRPILDLFWNVVVWGGSSGHRFKDRIAKGIHANTGLVGDGLQAAARLSYEGKPEAAFGRLQGLIPHWGPAYFTKFLAFTSDVGKSPKDDTGEPTQALIVDSRVAVAWRCLDSPSRLPDPLTPHRYREFCLTVADAAISVGIPPEQAEVALFTLGQAVRTRERWLEEELEVTRGDRPPVGLTTMLDKLLEGRRHRRPLG